MKIYCNQHRYAQNLSHFYWQHGLGEVGEVVVQVFIV